MAASIEAVQLLDDIIFQLAVSVAYINWRILFLIS